MLVIIIPAIGGLEIMESKGLDIKTVDDLTTDKYVFKIPFYQRGYRWSADDAELLAKDIETYDGHYFLQPIIVRKIGDKNYELVDGQQRLTTLNLILEASKSERRFVLEYERDPALSSFDKLYHDEVKKRLSNISFSLDIKDKLLSTYFVFFDIGDSDLDGYSIFNTINDGKIQLADSDLIKASILYELRRTAVDSSFKNEFIRLWYTVSNHLANNEYYAFLIGHRYDDFGKKHINSRLDILLSELLPNQNRENAFPIFNAFRKCIIESIHNTREFIGKFIKQLKRLDDVLWEAFHDDEIFHYLGTLLALRASRNRNDATIHFLFCHADNSGIMCVQEQKLKNDFKKSIKNKIKELLCGKYTKIKDGDIKLLEKKDGDAVRDVLLLHNVFFVEPGKGKRFSFYSYQNEKWEIEHINPDTSNEKEEDFIDGLCIFFGSDKTLSIDEKKEKIIVEYSKLLEENIENLKDSNFPSDISIRMTDLRFDAAYKYFKKEFVADYEESKQGIWNLVLLDKSTNAGNQNKFFLQKRNAILDNVKVGKYILPATLYAFTKAYSLSLSHPFQWDKETDGEPYVQSIVNVLESYFDIPHREEA